MSENYLTPEEVLKKKQQHAKDMMENARLERILDTYATIDIRLETGHQRRFRQTQISGDGFRCLWRSISQSYFNTPVLWMTVLQRAHDIYREGVSNDPVFLNSPLQQARRTLYEEMARIKQMESGSADEFHKQMTTGEWGEWDSVKLEAQ